LEGLGQLLSTIEMIRANLHHSVRIAGALVTMHDRRERLSREVVKNLRRYFPYHVFQTEVPRSISLAEAPSFSRPVLLYNPNSPGGRAYEQVTREILNQETVRARTVARQVVGNFNMQ
jgi:chromosome partitioning protein